MTEQEALDVIAKLVTAIQKYRSNALEELPAEVQEMAGEVQPHTLGKGKFLEILIKVSDSGTISTLDFNNMMMMAHGSAPESALAYEIIHAEPLPMPDYSLVTKGWDD